MNIAWIVGGSYNMLFFMHIHSHSLIEMTFYYLLPEINFAIFGNKKLAL